MHAYLVFALIFFVSTEVRCRNSKKEEYLSVVNTIFEQITQTTFVDPSTSLSSRQACPDTIEKLLTDDVTVVVYDIGTFTGKDLASEYFCIPTVQINGNIAVTNVTSSRSLLDCKNDALWVMWTISATVRIPNPNDETNPYDTILYPNPATAFLSAKIAFDKNNKIVSLDAYFGNYIAYLAYGSSTPVDPEIVLEQFCELALAACAEWAVTPGNDFDLGNVSLPVDQFIGQCAGTIGAYAASNTYFDGLGSPTFQTDTFACREAHLPMAFIDPDVHCPHIIIASTMCTQTTYILS